ncbi:MAG: sulfurtransferase TusA family protein [Natrialbaceae archaeon]|nr:sulfurtransferase TusA family protein [Natrialbaceae archaeon]
MSSQYDVTESLDATGLSCPMPIVKSKQAIDSLDSGSVLEVVATDAGSVSDMQGWTTGTEGIELLEQVEDGDRYIHYIEKTA